MAKLTINIGTADKGDGDPLRVAFNKVNENFTELYSLIGSGNVDLSAVAQHIIPETTDTYDLGSPTHQWRSMYVGTNTLYIDNVPITLDGNGNLTVDGSVVGGGSSVTASDTPPDSPSAGNLWYDTNSGRMYVYFDSTWVDANPVDGAGISSTNELVNGDYTVSLGSTGVTQFPVFEGDSLFIQGPEIGSENSSIAISAKDNILITADILGETPKQWQFGTDGVLTVPHMFPRTFTATVDAGHYYGEGSLTLEGDAWHFDVTFNANSAGYIENIITNETPWASNPGYVNDIVFRFTEADHGVPGYTFDLTLTDIQNPGPMMYTTNLTASPAPAYPATIKNGESIKLTADATSFIFGADGNIHLPAGGDIVDSNGDTVLGGGGSTGNIRFVDNAIYALGGVTVENADLTHGATSALILPVNGSDPNPAQLNNFYGAVEINTGYNNANTWTFDNDGVLTLPGGTDTIKSNTNGLDLSVLGIDDETVLTVNLSRSGALNVPQAVNFNFLGTYTGLINAQPDEIVIAGVPNTSIRIAPNDGANGTFLFGTDGTLTLPDTNTIKVGITPTTGTQLTGIESYLGAGAPYNYVWNNVACPNFVTLFGLGESIVGWTFYTVGQEGSAVTITEYAPIGSWSLGFSGDPGAGPYVAHSSGYVAEHANPINIETNSNTWTFDIDGKLILPGELDLGGQTYTSSAIVWQNGNGAVVNYNSVDNYFVIKANDTGGSPGKYWKFHDDGTTTLPSGAGFANGDNGQLKTNDGTTLSLDFRDTSGRGFYTNSDGFSLRGDGDSTWLFKTNGNLQLPAGGGIVDSTGTSVLGGDTSVHNVSLISTSGTVTLAGTADIVLVDVNAAGGDIFIFMPSSPVNGKCITVKNINHGANNLYVQPGNPRAIETESGSVGSGFYATMNATGAVITWVFYNDTWRIISKAGI